MIIDGNFQSFPFPNQRVSDSEKNKPEWYANCCDWIIAQGISLKNIEDTESKYNILHGNIPTEFYKKTLNPYNSLKDKYTRFPATLRNYDFIKGVIRRYVSEYIKNPHDFIVTAVNPEIILAKNTKLKNELTAIVQEKIAEQIKIMYENYIKEGNDPAQFNPEEFDVDAFIKEFNENYIDDVSAQGQDLLNVIRQITQDSLFYARAYFDYVTFGEAYTYAEVKGKDLIKRNVSVLDAYPIPNNNMFAEDYDMFAERMKMTLQQILDNYDEYLTPKEREFLTTYYAKHPALDSSNVRISDIYEAYFPELCAKFDPTSRSLFKREELMTRDINNDLYDVWHVVWRGEERKAIVTYVNEINIISKRVEPDNYKLNKANGDISIEYVYQPQVYESVRIGTRNHAIYPYGARAVAYNRNGKLPYNGINEVLPGFGKFSLVEELTPYQVLYNIIAYHRELTIARLKLATLVIPKSLLGTNPEDTIYRMVADGVLYLDDEVDSNMLKAQQIRVISASIGEYVTQLTNLLDSIKNNAKEQVDMTPQRYGEIANSAGKGVTEEAIARGSMGSVIIEFMFDSMRERDYARDMDFSKFAWIDGLDTSFKDEDGNLKYMSLDVNNHIYADYCIYAKNSVKELEKLNQLKQYAFNASQNGQDEIAIAAIIGDNVANIKKLIDKFKEIQRQHEVELQQIEQQTEQIKQQFELQKIAVKGEEDRKTLELEGIIKRELALIEADSNAISYNADLSDSTKNAIQSRLNDSRNSLDREKLNLEKQKIAIDAYNKNEDRKLKDKQIESQKYIARINRNRFDVNRKPKR